MKRLRKWWATMAVAWQSQAAYRLNFVLLVLGPALVFFFVKVSLWTSIYAGAGGGAVGGIGRQAMVAYQCHVLMIGLLSQGYTSVSLAEDIRLGRITAQLLHPFPFLEVHCARWLAFQLLQLLVVGVLLGTAVTSGLLPVPDPGSLAVGLAFTCLVAGLWFAFNLVIGLLAFWLEQTWVLRVILKDVGVFLSGAILPLELYPEGMRRALLWTPFPYLTWVPARIVSGEYPDVAGACLMTLAWTAGIGLVCWGLWRRGLRLYSAAGM